jgi:C4-dicarboxylate-specific signal transduction histidine kinase
MEAMLWKRNDNLQNDFKDIISGMKSSLDFMQNSISEFNNFYSNSSQITKYNLANEIHNIVDLLSAKIMYTNATLFKELDYNINLVGYKSAFANVCLVIIDNALDIFKQRQIDKGIITINLTQENNIIKLIIKDNGGGIKIEPIEKIFDVFVSDKADGNGMGLAMVKVLVKERLGGNIYVHNDENGAVFEVDISGVKFV